MAVIQRRQGARGVRYRAMIRLAGRDPISRTFDSRADAVEWAREVERDMRRSRAGIARAAPSMAELIDRYDLEVLSARAPRTASTKRRHLAYWREVIGHIRADQLTAATLVECREDLRRGRDDGREGDRSPSTVNRYLETISHLLAMAAREWQVIDTSPAPAVRHLAEPQGRVRFLSDAEREALLEACEPDPVLHLAVLLSITTGLRQGELLELRWRDIDLDSRRILVERTKTGRRRAVPVPAVALEALEALRGPAGERVFPAVLDSERRVWLRYRFERALEAAGITGFRWHDMRHTAASYLAMSGATLRDLAELLGHTSLAMVQRYSHLTHDHLLEAVDRMTTRRGFAGAAAPPPRPGRR